MRTQYFKLLASVGFCAALSAVACGSGTEDPGNVNGDGDGTKGSGSSGNLGGSDGNGNNNGSGASGNGTGSSGNGTGSSGNGDFQSVNGQPNDVDFIYDPSLDQDPPTCASDTIQAELIPLDVVLILDKSGSMNQPFGNSVSSSNNSDCDLADVNSGSRWCNSINAINGFVTDPSSVGMGFGMDAFSSSANSCGADTNLSVGLNVIENGDGNGQLASIASNLDNWTPSGNTATEEAIRTIIYHTSARKDSLSANGTNRKVIGVLVTDGDPNGCREKLDGNSSLNQLAVNHFSDTEIPIFFIGMTGFDSGKLNRMAVNAGAEVHTDYCASGDSSCSYYSVGDGSPQAFIETLNAIRESVSGCEFAIPSDAGLVDLSSVDVTFTPGGGSAETLSRIANEAACNANDEYYIEGSGNDAIIKLCPAMCERNDTNSSVDIEIKCEGS